MARKWQPPDSSGIDPAILKWIKLAIVPVLVGLVVMMGFFGSFFTIEPEEQGLVLRFGKHVRTLDPGLHYKLPFGMEKVYRVPVQRTMKEEFGFRTTKTDEQSKYTTEGLEEESLMLTGDLNCADVEWIVQYRIHDPIKYLFNVRSVDATFRDMNEAVMRKIVGDRSVDEVITWGKEEINTEARNMLQELCDQYETGIKVEMVMLQDVNAPPEVQPSWNDVNAAEQEKDRLINEARTKYNTEVPQARGEADRKIREAEGYAIERVNNAKGESVGFLKVYDEYKRNPEVTRKRIYLETMATVMPKVGRKLVVDKDEGGTLKLLNLDAGAGK